MEKVYSIDLHMHSTISDGRESPVEVIHTAERVGLKKICLTDHDCIHTNYDKLREYAKTRGVEVLPFMGCEVNTMYFEGEKPLLTVHMLVFGKDENMRDERFISMINKYFSHTNEIALRQFERLPEIDVDLSYDDVFLLDPDIAPVYKNDMYSASHVMKCAAAKLGVPADELRGKYPDLFPYNYPSRSVYLKRIADMPDTVELIELANKLGLVTVMAHPSWIEEFWECDKHLRTNERAEAIVRDLAKFGLDGLEVSHQEVDADGATELMYSLADELGLITTGGSDYHAQPNYGYHLTEYGATEEELQILTAKIEEKAAAVRKN